jgi:hypothetical protein
MSISGPLREIGVARFLSRDVELGVPRAVADKRIRKHEILNPKQIQNSNTRDFVI